MKKLYFLFAFFCLFQNVDGQIINFTNLNLKQRLLIAGPVASQYAKDVNGNYVKIDLNSNGQIEVSEALNIHWLNVTNCDTDNLVGIEYFTNLRTFFCSSNPITSFGTVLDGLTNLQHIIFNNTQISYLNTALHPGLLGITANNNPNLINIDLSVLHELQYLYVDHCDNLQSIDVSQCPNMIQMWVDSCTNLHSLNIKNGVDEDCIFYDCNSLEYICCDEVELQNTSYRATFDAADNCIVNSYCTVNPGGEYFVINGSKRTDITNNGCELTDPVYRNLKFHLSSTSTFNMFFGDATGNYSVGVAAGSYTLTPVLENPSYFNISPTITTVNFPTASSPATRNFCITPNALHHDLEIVIVPLQPARPGFNCTYTIFYKNKGNQTQSGTINFQFNDAILDLIASTPMPSTQNSNSFVWNFSNLLPLESREIQLTLNINSPMETPAVNGGDVLNFTSTIAGLTDEVPLDNVFPLNQTVVNSFDPNDKRCLQGSTISTTQVGEYVHYMIRFENTGTFPAENIIISDGIDPARFSIWTMIPLSGSHPYITRVVGNKLEFVFENINLPFNDEDNDGYIVFKIKTQPNLVAGNTFSNTAHIYFDYNFPIITNTATTTIQALANPDFEFENHFVLAPNPVKDVLTIQNKSDLEITSLSIYNVLGQLVLTVTQPNSNLDVSHLKSGHYYIKVMSTLGSSSSTFIKI